MINLSIIIPHFNSPESLKKLLLTIPALPEVQTLVIDDKSDKNIKELNSLKNNEKFKEVTFLDNNTGKKGAGVCRNLGLEKAKGKWILFADADDYFVSGFYDEVCKYLDTEYDLIYFTPTSVELDTGLKSTRHRFYEKLIYEYKEDKSTINKMRLRYQFFVPWSKLIKLSLIKKNNILFEEIIASNDIMFSAKVGHHLKSFFATTKVIYCVTRSTGTLTTNINEKMFDARLQAYIDYCNFLKNKLSETEVKSLHLNGMGLLLRANKAKLGIKKVIKVYIRLKQNNIKIFDIRLANPKYAIKKMRRYHEKSASEKRYLK